MTFDEADNDNETTKTNVTTGVPDIWRRQLSTRHVSLNVHNTKY